MSTTTATTTATTPGSRGGLGRGLGRGPGGAGGVGVVFYRVEFAAGVPGARVGCVWVELDHEVVGSEQLGGLRADLIEAFALAPDTRVLGVYRVGADQVPWQRLELVRAPGVGAVGSGSGGCAGVRGFVRLFLAGLGVRW